MHRLLVGFVLVFIAAAENAALAETQSPLGLCDSRGRTVTETLNVNTVNRYWASLNARDIATFDSLIKDDIAYRAPGTRDKAINQAGLNQSNAAYFSAFPDLRFDILRQFAEGSIVVTVYRTGGTFVNPFFIAPGLPPIQPTGRNGFMEGIEVFTLDGSEVARSQDVWDNVTFATILGANLSAPSFAYPPTLESAPRQPTCEPVRSSQEKANVATAIGVIQALNARSYSTVAGVVTSDFDFITPVAFTPPSTYIPLDVNGFIGYHGNLATAFPDREIQVLSTVVEGDDVAIQYAVGGGHYGALATPSGILPATGRMTSVRGTMVLKMQSGKIKEIIDLFDFANLFSQLGL